MTLDEYIDALTQLRNHYNAGDFKVMTDEVHLSLTEHGQYSLHDEPVAMGHDDFCLDLRKKVYEIRAKIAI